MPAITRRNLLKQSPTMLAIAAAPVAAAVSTLPAQAMLTENPDLVAAYGRFLAARADVAEAQDALEWLVDEWRHRWPLAPAEILGSGNAREYNKGAERDIAGRIIVRDTADLTSFKSAWREENPKACFLVHWEDWFQETITAWERPRTARTEKALAKKQADQVRILADYRERLRLAKEYHAETARLREASGVEAVKQRIDLAKAELRSAALAVSIAPVETAAGLRMKAEVLKDDDLVNAVAKQNGILGDLVRFMDSALAVIGGASA